MMLLKYCNQYARKFGKLSRGYRTGKSQFSFQSQRKTMPKNVQTTVQLHSSHMLTKYCSKFSKSGINSMWTMNFQIFKLVLKRKRNQDQIVNVHWIIKKAKKVPEHLFQLSWLCQSLWLCGSQYTVKNSERDGNTRLAGMPLERAIFRSGSNS